MAHNGPPKATDASCRLGWEAWVRTRGPVLGKEPGKVPNPFSRTGKPSRLWTQVHTVGRGAFVYCLNLYHSLLNTSPEAVANAAQRLCSSWPRGRDLEAFPSPKAAVCDGHLWDCSDLHAQDSSR